ncbi:hypothetical protein V8G54_030071, partial [Vigna mungo]
NLSRFHLPLKTKRPTFLPSRKRKCDYLSTPSQEERATLESQTLQLPIMDKETHLFHRLLKTKKSTFLPLCKRKCDYLSSPSKEEMYNPRLTKYSQKTYLKFMITSHDWFNTVALSLS